MVNSSGRQATSSILSTMSNELTYLGASLHLMLNQVTQHVVDTLRNTITEFILHFPSVQISIALLAALNNLKLILNDSDLFNSLLYDLQHNNILILFCPTQGQSTSLLIQGLIRCHTNTSLVIVIISKRCNGI